MIIRSLLHSGRSTVMILGSHNLGSGVTFTLPEKVKLFPSKSKIGGTASFHVSSVDERARKGTRERKSKGKKKIEQKIRPFLQKLEEERYKVLTDKRPLDKSHYPTPVDDVYFYRKYQPKQWSFQEALQNHRETHHPTVYNLPNSPLILRIDMDFRYPNRPQKCMDGWKSTVEMKAPFLLSGMAVPTVLAILPNDEDEIARTLSAGAEIAGSIDIVKQIQQGQIRASDYEYIVCHPQVLPEITPIRGLLKKNFPNFKNGTISVDVPESVKTLKAGLKIRVISNPNQPDYAYIDSPIGTLDMDAVGLQQNFESILSDTLPRRVTGKTIDEFIIQCLLKTPNTFEAFKINLQEFIPRCDKKTKGSNVGQAQEETTEEDEPSVDKVAVKQ